MRFRWACPCGRRAAPSLALSQWERGGGRRVGIGGFRCRGWLGSRGSAARDAYDEAQRSNQEVAARRDRIAATLRERFGWQVWPSAANFLLADTGERPARDVYEGLKQRRVLVRYFGKPPVENCLRIS